MANELVNMGEQFSGLPMGSLIGAPLKAACESQLLLAKATADFIQSVGFDKDNKLRTAKFAFTKVMPDTEGTDKLTNIEMYIEAPMLSIVSIPNLAIKTVDITFDMEVKSSFEDKSSSDSHVEGEAGFKWGGFSASIKGSVSSHKEQTRKSDNSAKYHVQVLARDDGMPEGLSRILDVMQSMIVPQSGPVPAPETT